MNRKHQNLECPWYDSTAHPLRIACGIAHHGPTCDVCPPVIQLQPGAMALAAAEPDLGGTVRTDKPWLDGLPRTIRISPAIDLFSADIPVTYLDEEVISVVESPRGRLHQWMLLTEHPDRMARFAHYLERLSSWPSHLWVGTIVRTRASLRRVQSLLEICEERADCGMDGKWFRSEWATTSGSSAPRRTGRERTVAAGRVGSEYGRCR